MIFVQCRWGCQLHSVLPLDDLSGSANSCADDYQRNVSHRFTETTIVLE